MRSRPPSRRRAAATRAIFVAYADCGTGGLLAARCAALGVEMIAGPHCYSFFDGNAAFAERGDDEMRAFYLTDFLVRQFDAFVWRPMGLDRHPELRDMLFGNYRASSTSPRPTTPRSTPRPRAARSGSASPTSGGCTGYGDLARRVGRGQSVRVKVPRPLLSSDSAVSAAALPSGPTAKRRDEGTSGISASAT